MSQYERTQFAENYFARILEIEAQQEELETFANLLIEISEGHTVLYNNVGKMTDTEVQKELNGYGRQMSEIITSLYKK